MENFNKKILISTIIFFIIILLTISAILANKSNGEDIKVNNKKILYEIKYLDKQIINISNLLNTNSSWIEVSNDIKVLYNYWNSVILDFNSLNIEKNQLTNFGKMLDNLAVSINNNNRQDSLNILIEVYSKLIIYSENLNYDMDYSNILYTKYYLLSAYSIAEKENWTLVHENILKSTMYFSKVVNSIDNEEYDQYNINQTYIAIKELENLIEIKNIDIFYIKYNIAMEKLENII